MENRPYSSTISVSKCCSSSRCITCSSSSVSIQLESTMALSLWRFVAVSQHVVESLVNIENVGLYI